MPIPEFLRGKAAFVVALALLFGAGMFALGTYADHTLIPAAVAAGNSLPDQIKQQLEAWNPLKPHAATASQRAL